MESIHLNREELEPFRSKLYLLNSDNGWLEQGIGFPVIVEENESAVLKFASEDTGNIVYQVTLTDELQFEQQDAKIFTWYNKRTNVDMALSFQSEVSAEKIWQRTNEIIANKKAFFGPFARGDTEEENGSVASEADLMNGEYILSIPNENNIQKFENDLIACSTVKIERKNLACQLLCNRKVYIENLIEIFRRAEENNDKEKLTILFRIFRQMVNMSNFDLYSVLLSDDYYLDVFGALEYDPGRVEGKNTISHRKYFQDHARFNQVGSFKDPEVLSAIHWNFRLMYLRDCVLAHYLDERILQYLSAIVNTNYIDILKYIHSSRDILSSLFDSLRNKKLNALKMIHEMCLVMKNLDVDKVAIFEVFAEYNIFETFEEIMTHTQSSQLSKMNKKEKKKENQPVDEIDVRVHIHMILEIMMLSLVQAPHCLREYCVSQHQKILKHPLLTFIVDKTINHEDPIIQNMLGEVIKHLIDASTFEENPIQILFYEKFLMKVLEVFDKPSNEERIKNSKTVILDLLIYCAKQQMDCLSKCIIPLDIPTKIFKNFQANDKFLNVLIVQLYKLLLACKEPEIINSLTKPLDEIVAYFVKHYKNKTNLIHSSLLEVFTLIIKEELYSLLNYLVETHKEFIEDPVCSFITEKIKNKRTQLASGNSDQTTEEQKRDSYPFNMNSRKGKASLTIISPFGNALAIDNSDHNRRIGPMTSKENSAMVVEKQSMGSPNKDNSPSPPNLVNSPTGEKDLKRTSSNLAKLVDYDDEMEFNMETRGKDMNFLLEDIQLKKRKLDDLNSVTVLNK